VPTITLEGDANGAPHPDPASYTKKFADEAPQAFAKAVIDVDALAAGRRSQG
jgi:hypothetical protein